MNALFVKHQIVVSEWVLNWEGRGQKLA